MDLLIDTHVFIWWDSADPRLGGVAAATISDSNNRVFVSAASVWEIAVKQQAGRLMFNGSPSKAIAANGFRPLPISGDHVEAAAKLPSIHQDPFDRILIAQALDRQLVLVTADGLISRYAVPLLSAAK